jgi:hypothetical protein
MLSTIVVVASAVVGWHKNTVAVLVTTCVPSIFVILTINVFVKVEVVVERISAPRFFTR